MCCGCWSDLSYFIIPIFLEGNIHLSELRPGYFATNTGRRGPITLRLGPFRCSRLGWSDWFRPSSNRWWWRWPPRRFRFLIFKERSHWRNRYVSRILRCWWFRYEGNSPCSTHLFEGLREDGLTRRHSVTAWCVRDKIPKLPLRFLMPLRDRTRIAVKQPLRRKVKAPKIILVGFKNHEYGRLFLPWRDADHSVLQHLVEELHREGRVTNSEYARIQIVPISRHDDVEGGNE